MEWESIAKIFREYPGYLALLIVIFLFYRIILSHKETIHDLTNVFKGDSDRVNKLTTLLEVLVHKTGRGD